MKKHYFYFAVAFQPILAFVGAMFAAVGIGMAVILARYRIFTGGYVDYIPAALMDHLFLLAAIGYLAAFAAVFPWYRIMLRKEEKTDIKALFTGKHIILWLLLSFVLQIAGNLVAAGLYQIMPSQVERYVEMIEMAGLDEMTFLSLLVTVIGAPLVEEITFRGLTYKYVQKTGAGFWVCNLFQAFCFGLSHMNLVQGIYAFGIGIVLGLMVREYGSILPGILVHFGINLSGTLLPVVLEHYGLDESLGVLIILYAIAAVCAGICFRKRREFRRLSPAAESESLRNEESDPI